MCCHCLANKTYPRIECTRVIFVHLFIHVSDVRFFDLFFVYFVYLFLWVQNLVQLRELSVLRFNIQRNATHCISVYA